MKALYTHKSLRYLLRASLSIGFIFSVIGCVSLQSVSLTPVPKQRNQVVKAEVSKTIFLAFNFDNDFVDELSEKLEKQCKGGLVTGILTKDSVTNYLIAHTRTIQAQGYCIKSRKNP